MLVKYVLCVFYVLLVLIFTNGIVHYIFLCSHFFHKTLFFMTIKVAMYIACRICWVLHSRMWCVCLLCLSIHSLTQLPAANMHTFPYIFSLTDLLLWDLKAREGSADGRTSIHLIKPGGGSVTQRVTQCIPTRQAWRSPCLKSQPTLGLTQVSNFRQFEGCKMISHFNLHL